MGIHHEEMTTFRDCHDNWSRYSAYRMIIEAGGGLFFEITAIQSDRETAHLRQCTSPGRFIGEPTRAKLPADYPVQLIAYAKS
jgi:hypothetical protein